MNVPVTRDEFETVKQLLASAATYSESANRKCDRNADAITRLEASQHRTEEQLQAFITETRENQRKTDESLQQLTESQRKTEQSLQQLTETQKKTEEGLQRFTQQTEQNLAQLTQGVDALSQRVDSFVFESQRLHTDHAQKINRLDAMISRYDGVLAYLMRKDHPEME